MPSKGDFVNPLVEEILSDMAGSFFEARTQLDAKIDLFRRYVERLRARESEVQTRAAFLNHLLIKGKQAPAFYNALGVDGSLFLEAEGFEPPQDLKGVPFAFGFHKRFMKIAANAYEGLQRVIAVYLDGPPDTGGIPGEERQVPVYYRLISEMHRLLNQEIDRINAAMSPSCTLQFARKFDHETTQKERITGGGVFDSRSLDEKLCYLPIDLASLGLKKFPQLPPLNIAAPAVREFCMHLCNDFPQETRKIIKDLNDRLRRSHR